MIGQQDDTRDCSAITNRESQESKDFFLPCLRLLVAVPKSPSIRKDVGGEVLKGTENGCLLQNQNEKKKKVFRDATMEISKWK